jgi:hypothetical protein
MGEASPPDDLRATLRRAAKIALLLVAVGIVGIVVAAWIVGDPSNLPFDYEGFD